MSDKEQALARAYEALANDGGYRSLGAALVNRTANLLSRRDRRKLGCREPWQLRAQCEALLADAVEKYIDLNGPALSAAGIGGLREDSDTPWLDFLRDLIDAGKIREFLEWLFEALPVLIKAIVDIFV